MPRSDRKSHESWGKINVSRVSGCTNLFRSSLKHHNWIELTISNAVVVDDTGTHDFLMEAGPPLITVAMSETQFARMISSLNMGEGTACTLEAIGGHRLKSPEPEDRAAHFEKTHNEHLDGNAEKIRDIGSRMQEMLDRKHRPTLKEMAELIHEMRVAGGNFDSNQDFYREQFREDMEKVVEEAKTEIESHIMNAVSKAGLEHLQAQMPALEVESRPRIEDSS